MQKIYVFLAMIFMAAGFSAGQSVSKDDIRVANFSRGDAPEAFFNASLKSASLAKESGGVVLIRICSGASLDEAIAKASGNIAEIITDMGSLKLPINQLYFSTNPKCSAVNNRLTGSVQFLVVKERSRASQFPSVPADQILIKDYDYPENSVDFHAVVSAFLSDLQSNKFGKAFIIAYSHKNRSRLLDKSIVEVQKAIGYRRLNMHGDVKVLDLEWYGVPGDQVDLNFPTLRMIRLLHGPGAAQNKLTLDLNGPVSVCLGHSFSIKITLTNKGADSVSYRKEDFWGIVDEQGPPVFSHKVYGHEFSSPTIRAIMADGFVLQTAKRTMLAPNKSVSQLRKFDTGNDDFYERPGRYTLSVTVPAESESPLTAHFTFDVVGCKQK